MQQELHPLNLPGLEDYEPVEPGVWLGQIEIGGLNFHAEVLELRSLEPYFDAVNPQFQNRIDDWLDRNEGCSPQILNDEDGNAYFIHAEVYAQ